MCRVGSWRGCEGEGELRKCRKGVGEGCEGEENDS